MATYNRSNVLRYALETVRWQSVIDWECLVIGDACTDDTGEVVASFEDPRIRFVNLAANVGEQSGPNNEGCRLARGRFIAFLNHDDFWFPEHLEVTLRALEETGADMVFTLSDIVKPGLGRFKPHRLMNCAPSFRYDPRINVPASTWVMRRETMEAVGPWKFYQESYLVPSQDWVFRAWKAGKDMRLVPEMTVVELPSGKRTGCYRNREHEEHAEVFERMRADPRFRERELTDIAMGYRMHWFDLQSPRHLMRQAMRSLFDKLCLKLGVHPSSVRTWWRDGRKGSIIDRLRRNRGLPDLDR
jgi:glycosyltransferase involved in cell wall biosynthesis